LVTTGRRALRPSWRRINVGIVATISVSVVMDSIPILRLPQTSLMRSSSIYV
jgi:hypothetical protein